MAGRVLLSVGVNALGPVGRDFPRGSIDVRRGSCTPASSPLCTQFRHHLASKQLLPCFACLPTTRKLQRGELVSEAQPYLSYLPYLPLDGNHISVSHSSSCINSTLPSLARHSPSFPRSASSQRSFTLRCQAKTKDYFSSPSISRPCATGVVSFPTDPLSIFALTPTIRTGIFSIRHHPLADLVSTLDAPFHILFITCRLLGSSSQTLARGGLD